MREKAARSALGTILIADDSIPFRNSMETILRREGYVTLTASDGAQSLRLLEENDVDLVLSDIRMPGMDGLTLLEQIRSRTPDIPVVLITAWPSVEFTLRALRAGARDFLTKPTSPADLLHIVKNQMKLRQIWKEEFRAKGNVEQSILHQLGQIREFNGGQFDELMPVLETLANILDAREHETQAHSERVSVYSEYLAERIGETDCDLQTIRIGGLMHDIGKMGIPDSVLLKPGQLDAQDWKIMKQHPQIGYNLVAGIPGLMRAAELVLSHHERWDGKGYPRGLKQKEIPFGARVFTLVDTMDAMLSDRPYRKALTYSEVRSVVELNRGTQFDPEIADAFLAISEHEWVQVVAERCPNLSRLTMDAPGNLQFPASL